MRKRHLLISLTGTFVIICISVYTICLINEQTITEGIILKDRYIRTFETYFRKTFQLLSVCYTLLGIVIGFFLKDTFSKAKRFLQENRRTTRHNSKCR